MGHPTVVVASATQSLGHPAMRFGSRASMIDEYGMQENISLFENTFDRTLESVGWQ